MDDLRQGFEEARLMLDRFIEDPAGFEKIETAGRLMLQSLNGGGRIISCGNGGSMCDAMHFAEEMTGCFRDDRRPLAAIAISDPSHITCTANDYGFESVFSRFIEAFGGRNDILLVISTSGNSENVVKAACCARDKGMKVVALTGRDGGRLAGLADVEIRVPHDGYSDRIQELHIKIIHALIGFIEKNL